MAYAVKYRAVYKDVFDTDWQVDLEMDNYVGSVIPVKTVQKEACIFSYDNNSDDKFEPIVSSSISTSLYNEGQIDVTELQEAGDKTFRIVVYKNATLYWVGYMIPDGIEQTFASTPYVVNVMATDGLMMLEGIEYSLQNMATPSGVSVRSPMNHIREILFRTQNLGILLPIRFASTVENTNFPGENALWGSVEWSPEGEGYNTFQGERRSCLWILENILKSFQLRIYQQNGRWNVERINDITTGTYDYIELSATTGVPVVTTGSEDANRSVTRGGDYAFINEDHLITIKPGIKKVSTTYNVDIGENIVPNGGFEYTSLGQPLYWRVRAGGFGSVTQELPLRDNSSKDPTLPDRSIRIDNSLGGGLSQVDLVDANGVLTGMPIDAKFFPRMNLSFLFSIEQAGANVPTFTLSLGYTDGTTTWYLNDMGIWEETVIYFMDFTVPNYQVGDVANIDFRVRNESGQINFPVLQDGGDPKELDQNDVQHFFITINVEPGAIVLFDDFRITVDNNNDIWEADLPFSEYTQNDNRELQISSTFNGFMKTSYRTTWGRNDNEFVFTDGLFTGSLTAMNSHSVLRNNHLSSKVFNGSIYGQNWSYGDILEIQTLEGKKFQQTRANYNTEIGISNITAIETRNDIISPVMRHYGTNDNIFSNFGST